MTNEEIFLKVAAFLEEELEIDAEKLTPDARLKADIGIDSLDLVDIVAFVRRTFGFKLQIADLRDVVTLGEFVAYIEQQLAK